MRQLRDQDANVNPPRCLADEDRHSACHEDANAHDGGRRPHFYPDSNRNREASSHRHRNEYRHRNSFGSNGDIDWHHDRDREDVHGDSHRHPGNGNRDPDRRRGDPYS